MLLSNIVQIKKKKLLFLNNMPYHWNRLVKMTFSYRTIILWARNRFSIGKRHWYNTYTLYLNMGSSPRSLTSCALVCSAAWSENAELERFQNRKKKSREKMRRRPSPLIVVGQYVVSRRRRWQFEGTGPIKNRQNRHQCRAEGRCGLFGFR